MPKQTHRTFATWHPPAIGDFPVLCPGKRGPYCSPIVIVTGDIIVSFVIGPRLDSTTQTQTHTYTLFASVKT